MGITFSHKGDFNNLERFLNDILKKSYRNILEIYGQKGVAALRAATPVDSGLAASSWYYTIEDNGQSSSLIFSNSNIEDGCNIAILVDKGHVTKNGSWVPGYHFIDDAIYPVMKELEDEVWRSTIG